MSSSILTFDAADAPFRADPAHSFTMPARFYTSAEVYELEKDAIFYKTWHYACHASQVSQPGAFFTTKIHEQNLFITRGRDDTLRAFYNVCAHRGHELVQG